MFLFLAIVQLGECLVKFSFLDVFCFIIGFGGHFVSE